MKEIAIQCQYIIHFLQLKKRRNFVHKSLQFSPSWSNFVMFFFLKYCGWLRNPPVSIIYRVYILLGINSIEYRTWAYDSIEMKLAGQFLL